MDDAGCRACVLSLVAGSSLCPSLELSVNRDSNPVCGEARKERKAVSALLALSEEPEVKVG